MTVDTKELCTTVAYLIGVRKHIIVTCFPEYSETMEKLCADKDATTIRYLCKLRTSLMLKFKKTDMEMRHNLNNIDRLPEWYDVDNIKQLEKWGYTIVKANHRSEEYAVEFSKMITENIDKCANLFPDWLNWNYIRDLFVIPKYTKKGVLVSEFNKYMANIEYYPFQLYIHWQPYDCGSMLFTDGKFLRVVYRLHGEDFYDASKFRDAHANTKNRIYDFINSSVKTAIAVDCENSDVYKLYGVLKNLNQDELSKIEKIILYDDSHTTHGWDWIYKFTKIPVEHIEVERVTENKSLVDIKMTAGVCKDYYENGITSFIIVSSDSDYWGLISSLPKANFLVMYEYAKCGQAIKHALFEHDIYYCAIDDFCTGNIDELKKAVLLNILKRHLPNILDLNLKELVPHIYKEARIEADKKEMDNFYNKYVKTLKLVIDDNGDTSIEIKS